MLTDTGATMNTGNQQYHLWVMSKCPEIVSIFLLCDKHTAYDLVQILAAFDLHDANQHVNYGEMTVVMRYKTPYNINN